MFINNNTSKKSIYKIMKTDIEIRGFIIGLLFIIFIVKVIKRY